MFMSNKSYEGNFLACWISPAVILFCMHEKCRKNVEKADVRMFDCKLVISVYKLTAIFLFFFIVFLFLK